MRARLISGILIAFTFLSATNAFGQKKFSVEKIINNLDSLRVARLETGKGMFTPFIAPAYTPEMKFLVSVGGLYTFKTQKDNPRLERSSIPISISYSTNNSFYGVINLNMYGRDDRYRIIGEYALRSMPDHYWGVGYSNGKEKDKSDSTTLYHRDLNKVLGRFLYRIGHDFFGGLFFEWSDTKASYMNDEMACDPNILEYGTNIKSTGIGGVLQYDSRDNMITAYSGKLIDLGVTYYGRLLGATYEFWVFELEYRGFIPASKTNHRSTLAWKAKIRTTLGDTPWTKLSELGNPYDFRGYYWGRYRDRSMLFGLLEYRHTFMRKHPNRKGSYESKHGVVTWAGMGSIGEKLNDLEHWLPNAGIGYRFEIQPRFNLRVDFGVGVKSKGFYFNFGEGF
ncbi:MAG: hypothetical protein PHD25_07870 [Bacteroidales bacterium]|nr:hypothetical protein [Bacteroidales bacterium]